jgi:two-component system nitrate/nitrite sensor histidine kinase NarX
MRIAYPGPWKEDREEARMPGDGGTKLAAALSTPGLSLFENAGKRGTRDAVELLHKVLTQLLADPDSTEPFDLVLAHILELSGAEAGTIFVSTESGRQLVLLACAGPDERDRWIRFARQCNLYRAEGGSAAPEAVSDPEDPGSTILAQGFAQGASGHGLLLLRLAGEDRGVAPPAPESLRSYGEYLAGVLYSARCARMRLRNAQSEERAAIARELHDSLAQSLSYLKIKVSLLQDTLKKAGVAPDVETALQELRGMLSTANLQLRELITTFRLTMHGKTFAQALEDSIEEFERRSSIAFELDNRLPAGGLTAAEEMQLLLILREALCNVVRHSHATYCWVSVRLTDPDTVRLGVDDNGTGMQRAMHDSEPHHGLVIMQERARSLGGTLRVEDREGGGARLYVHCPREGGMLSNSFEGSA